MQYLRCRNLIKLYCSLYLIAFSYLGLSNSVGRLGTRLYVIDFLNMWCASYVTVAMLDDIDKGFCLSAMQISSNMAKIALSFESHGSGFTTLILEHHALWFTHTY
jgi:hypothetical protein